MAGTWADFKLTTDQRTEESYSAAPIAGTLALAKPPAGGTTVPPAQALPDRQVHVRAP